MNLKSKLVLSFGLLVLLSLVLPSTLWADTFTATGEGWCALGASCNNTTTSVLRSTFAGSINGATYADWFAFLLPNLGSPITMATLSVFNSGLNSTTNPAAVYNVYGATSFSFAGLTGGPSLGSVTLMTADTGVDHFQNIALNAAGLTLLNTDQGTLVILGGGVNGAGQNQIFGSTNGTPPAMLLTVQTVPEPFTLLLLGAGLFGILALRCAANR